MLEGEGAGPREQSPGSGTRRRAEELHEPLGARVAVAPAQSRRPPRRGLSPKRPRRSPPHCPQRSKNFATSRTGTNKYITPFNETTDNYPANLPPPHPGLQGSATFRALRPPPKGRGDLFKRQKKKSKSKPRALYLAHQLLSTVQMHGTKNVVSLQRFQQ